MLSSLLTVISPVELIAFVIAIVGIPIAVGSHGRIAFTLVILGLALIKNHSLLEVGCLLHDRAGCPTVLHLLHT